jgi:hypothetical protein
MLGKGFSRPENGALSSIAHQVSACPPNSIPHG